MRRFILCLFFLLLTTQKSYASFPKDWQKLMHYEQNNQNYTSLIETKSYFLTPNGRFDPNAEYNAHITAFKDPNNTTKCTFPARFLYLKSKGLAKGDLSSCKDYQQYLNDLQPKAITMLFTNAYMSNPSSLFGHTLFRIDTMRSSAQLLAHGANFGADTGDDQGVLYALKGLYGGYYGTFGIKPYYDVINLYNNIENRDIWEYELNLTKEEQELFVALIWELKEAKIRYYFFTKNCSYLLLSMLEATRPTLNLTSKFNLHAIPLSTLKEINSQNLIKNTTYRPSRQSKLQHRYRQMTNKQKKAFVDIIQNNHIDLSDLKTNEQADVLETAYQYIQYLYVEQKLELKEYRQKSFKLLTQRSQITDTNLYFEDLKTGENPIYSHQESALSLLLGAKNGNHFQELSLKPAYTSLLDNSYGLLKGAEINLLETKLRHYDIKDHYTLEALDILSIKSINGKDVMFSPFSYDIQFGLKQIFNPKTTKDSLALTLKTGIGEAYNLTHSAKLYIMTVPNIAYGGNIKENGYLGFGLRAGLYYNNKNFRFNTYAEQNYTTSSIYTSATYTLEASYSLSQNLNLYTSYTHQDTSYHSNKETALGLKLNF